MEPRPYPKPFNNPQYVFEVKWDGVRILAFLQNGEMRLQNRKGRIRTAQYPEMRALVTLTGGGEAIFDGEMVVLGENNRPSFPAILRRDLVKQEEKVPFLSRQWPVTYVIFDLLWWEGESMLDLPWEARYTKLRQVLTPSSGFYLNENFQDGLSLFAAVKEQGLEGIVAKKKTSPYLPGTKSHYWLKIKSQQRQNCVIGGYLLQLGELTSLLIGAYLSDRLVYLGKVSAALPAKEKKKLTDFLARSRIDRPPFSFFSEFLQGKEAFWVLPKMAVTVEFLEWTANLKLRAPKIAGFPRVAPEECKL